MSVEKLDPLTMINRKFRVTQLDAHKRTISRLYLEGKGMTSKEAARIVDLERRIRFGRFK